LLRYEVGEEENVSIYPSLGEETRLLNEGSEGSFWDILKHMISFRRSEIPTLTTSRLVVFATLLLCELYLGLEVLS